MHKSIYTRQYEVLLALLREAREKSGLTQTDLAQHLAMSQSDVSKCEIGTRRLDIIEVKIWAETLGIDFLELVQNLEERTRSDIVLKGATSAKRQPKKS